MYIKDPISYTLRTDLSVFIPHIFESLFIDLNINIYIYIYIYIYNLKQILGVIYKPNIVPKTDVNIYSTTHLEVLEIINMEKKAKCNYGRLQYRLF